MDALLLPYTVHLTEHGGMHGGQCAELKTFNEQSLVPALNFEVCKPWSEATVADIGKHSHCTTFSCLPSVVCVADGFCLTLLNAENKHAAMTHYI